MSKFIELPCVVSHRSAPDDITITEITDETIIDMWFGEDERDTTLYLQPVAFLDGYIESLYPSRVTGITNVTASGGSTSIVAMEYGKLKDLLEDPFPLTDE